MDNTKTIREWLEELPEPYRSQAIVNAEVAETINRDWEIISMNEAIYSAFVWDCSNEGHNYWSKFKDTL